MTGTARRLFAFALSFFLLAGHTAWAAGAAPGEAKRHFDTGVRLAEDRNFSGALVEFEASYRQTPTAATLQNVAVCQKSLFRYADAVTTLERMLRDYSAQLSAGDRRAADDAIAEMKALLGTIVIRTTPPGARVTINEQPMSPQALNGPVSIAAGQYRIAAEAPGYGRTERTVSVVSGQKDVPIDLVLAPSTDAPPPAEPPAISEPTTPQTPPDPVLPQRGWFAFAAIGTDTLVGALPANYQANGPRQGASLGTGGGYRISRRMALEGQIEVSGHTITTCPKGMSGCAADSQLKYGFSTARLGPNVRMFSNGRTFRAVGHAGIGVAAHSINNIQIQDPTRNPFTGKLQGAGGYVTLGIGAELNVKHFLFDLLLVGTVETKGVLQFAQRTITEGGIALRVGYGAWKP
jgi:hypothetical protein